jgi:hypothetical protein
MFRRSVTREPHRRKGKQTLGLGTRHAPGCGRTWGQITLFWRLSTPTAKFCGRDRPWPSNTHCPGWSRCLLEEIKGATCHTCVGGNIYTCKTYIPVPLFLCWKSRRIGRATSAINFRSIVRVCGILELVVSAFLPFALVNNNQRFSRPSCDTLRTRHSAMKSAPRHSML